LAQSSTHCTTSIEALRLLKTHDLASIQLHFQDTKEALGPPTISQLRERGNLHSSSGNDRAALDHSAGHCAQRDIAQNKAAIALTLSSTEVIAFSDRTDAR
jgi:hypothetical protein